ncbi:hypothetical protein AB0N09_05070 [Streptomyces erythrochromogenes]|uniref:hypothetical protein n=1 Tax=Streptomyces erythrochromogenes TaxID=285574 RepID=UPI00342BD2E0
MNAPGQAAGCGGADPVNMGNPAAARGRTRDSAEVTAPDVLETPARRRRNARLIATLTELIGDCAQAAGSVYRPIADTAPEQSGVAVNLVPIAVLSAAAGPRLDASRAEDAARWPDFVAREAKEEQRTFEARCAAAEAEKVLTDVLFGQDEEMLPGPGSVALPTAPRSAAMAPAGIGGDFLVDFVDDPEVAINNLRAAVSTGEFTAGQILDEAVDNAVLAGLLALREAQGQREPSSAAETCLMATRQFAMAVTLASADLEDSAF